MAPETSFVDLMRSADFLTSGEWRLFRPDGSVATDRLRFLPDGNVTGYNGTDEARWLIDEDTFCLADINKNIKTRFKIENENGIRLTLCGRYQGIENIVLRLELRNFKSNKLNFLENLRAISLLDENLISSLGFFWNSIIFIFENGPIFPKTLQISADTPNYVQQQIFDQTKRSSFGIKFLQNDLKYPDISLIENSICIQSLTRSDVGELQLDILPFFYKMTNSEGLEYWLISHNIFGAIDLIYVPGKNLVISRDHQYFNGSYKEILTELFVAIDSADSERSVTQKKIAVIDMIGNFAHVLINHLSAIEHLQNYISQSQCDELWISGFQFFDTVAGIFPDLPCKIRHFPSRWALAQKLVEDQQSFVKIGAAFAPDSLIRRVQRAATRRVGPARFAHIDNRPLIAFTIRESGRQCRNLVEMITDVTRELITIFPNIGLVLDGFVIPDDGINTNSVVETIYRNVPYQEVIWKEMSIARQIEDLLPPNTVRLNLIGMSMSESLIGLRNISAYVAHVGTPQHKIGFFERCPGIVHGPQSQMTHIEVGTYQCESENLPIFLPSEYIEDISGKYDRGNRFSDYKITNFKFISGHLKDILLEPRRFPL